MNPEELAEIRVYVSLYQSMADPDQRRIDEARLAGMVPALLAHIDEQYKNWRSWLNTTDQKTIPGVERP
jgi:hypothetical protein